MINTVLRYLTPLLGLPLTLAAQSSITLQNGNLLTGQIQTLKENGECELTLSATSTPITIKAGMLEAVEFNNDSEKKHHPEILTLINGDKLPCEITALTNNNFEVSTHYGGNFKIPRNHIHSVTFNRSQQQTLYSGPEKRHDFEQLDQWKVLDNTLHTNTSAAASIELPLPENFSVSFTAKWNGERPKFRLYLCSDAYRKADIENAYFIDFTISNIQIYRTTPSRPKQRIGQIPIRLKELSQRTAEVQVQVDRKLQQLSLFVDGNSFGTFDDTEIFAPSANWTLFEANMQNEELILSDIIFKEHEGNLFSGELEDKPLDDKLDTFYDNEGLSYTGELTEISTTEQKRILSFDSKHADTPLKVPLKYAHRVHLANSIAVGSNNSNYVIKLHNGGLLHLSNLQLDSNNALTTHPILGVIKLGRDSLSSLTKTPSTDAN